MQGAASCMPRRSAYSPYGFKYDSITSLSVPAIVMSVDRLQGCTLLWQMTYVRGHFEEVISGRGRTGLQLLQPSTLLDVLSSDELDIQSERQVLEVLCGSSACCCVSASHSEHKCTVNHAHAHRPCRSLKGLSPSAVLSRQLWHGGSMTSSRERHHSSSSWPLCACRPRSCSTMCVRPAFWVWVFLL